jgi:hypothetical protein
VPARAGNSFEQQAPLLQTFEEPVPKVITFEPPTAADRRALDRYNHYRTLFDESGAVGGASLQTGGTCIQMLWNIDLELRERPETIQAPRAPTAFEIETVKVIERAIEQHGKEWLLDHDPLTGALLTR